MAYMVIVVLWVLGKRKSKTGRALTDFDEFLVKIVRGHVHRNRIMPEWMIESIQRVEATLPTSHQDPRTAKLCDLVRRVVSDVRDLVTPALTRRVPFDAGVIISARIGLVAAAAFTEHVMGMEESYSLLCEVVYCLTVMQQRIEGDIIPNEVIVLLRA